MAHRAEYEMEAPSWEESTPDSQSLLTQTPLAPTPPGIHRYHMEQQTLKLEFPVPSLF